MSEVQTAADIARSGSFVVNETQLAKMREIAKVVYDDPGKIAEFERDPMGFAKSVNGFEPPAGFHLHIADASNNLIPPEEDGIFGAESRTTWDRLEFRVGYKTVSLVACY
ncbi:MAG: hypothetical protein JNK46_10665 [Methylobacteriaceae bacterium]|nr:hypothetical protein [Methylobacteriaceae bacterium]